MIDFLENMKKGNKQQQLAYKAIADLEIMDKLRAYSPLLCGTIPIAIDVEDSDLDIIMEVYDLAEFENHLSRLYKNTPNYRMKRKNINSTEIVKANFFYKGFEFELFGQAKPVHQQNAYLHMIIEYRLLQEDPSLRVKIIELKNQGYKTEPAFCKLLNLSGNPYQAILHYGREKNFIE